jgi:hypothetical protein
VYSNLCALQNLFVLLVHTVLWASLPCHFFHCCESSRDDCIVDINNARLAIVKQIVCELTASENYFRHLHNSASSHLPVVSFCSSQHNTNKYRRSLDTHFQATPLLPPSDRLAALRPDTRSSQLLSHQQAVVLSDTTTYVHHQPFVLTTLAPISNLISLQSLCHHIIPAIDQSRHHGDHKQ